VARLFNHFPDTPKSAACKNAYWILVAGHESASSFLDIFQSGRQQRGAKGTATDEEQDLLRAMLMFAASTLDSMMKQLVRDALPVVIERQVGARNQLQAFVARALKRKDPCDFELIAQLMIEDSPRQSAIQELVAELTSSSLQSSEQVLRTAAFFDIPSDKVTSDPRGLQTIFRRRNQMAHEMDVDFEQSNRSRRSRAKQAMVDDTNTLFLVAQKFLSEVDLRVT
jgi:hypothetical protein